MKRNRQNSRKVRPLPRNTLSKASGGAYTSNGDYIVCVIGPSKMDAPSITPWEVDDGITDNCH